MSGRLARAFALCVLLIVGGCTAEPRVVVQPMDPAQDQLLQIAAAYRQVNLDRGTPPRSQAEIEPLLKSRGADPNVFISPRDGEPFVIAWGTEMVRLPLNSPTQMVIAHERTGKDGSRYAMMAEGNVMLLGDVEFDKATFANGIGPAALK